MDPNPFRGPPRPELDEAWDELTQYTSIKVTAEDLGRINRTSVQLADGSGMYFSGLNVHHQLHCLKMIRQSMYPDYYFKGEKPPRHQEDHIDHCIDSMSFMVLLSIFHCLHLASLFNLPSLAAILTGLRYPNGSDVQSRHLPRDL